MAITETRPETTGDVHVNPWDAGEPYPSFAATVGSGDHKTIGRLYIVFSALFGIGAWILSALVTVDQPLDVLPSDTVGQAYTLSRLGFVLLFALPMFLGLATYLVPLQVGASTLAFPRAGALAFWTWLLGSVMLVVAYAINGGVAGGRETGVELAYLAIGVTVLALLLATVCVVTTAIALRTTGMALDRVPLFSWSVFVAGGIWLLTLPVFLANVLLVYIDVRFGRPSDFGVASAQWPQLDWLVQQPQVFAFAIPVFGAVGDIVVTSAGARQRNRGVVLAAIGAFGIFSFGAFAQEYFNSEVWEQVLYGVLGVAIVLPVLALLGGWATTMRNGTPRLTTASVGALFAGLVLLLATVASALYIIKPLELHDSDVFQDGLLSLVIGVAVIGGVAALHHWGPKMWGHLPFEALGKLIVLLAAFGAVLAGLPLLVLGFANRWDGLTDAADFLNVLSAIGAATVAIALALTLLNLASMARGTAAGDDPWNGATLEWATSSPPAPGNFGELAPVESSEPLFDAKEAAS